MCVWAGKGKGVEGAQGIVLNGENSLAEQIPLISMNFSSIMINAIIRRKTAWLERMMKALFKMMGLKYHTSRYT